MKLTMDFESRATIDIKKCGGYVYAEHPDTEVLCLAVKPDDGQTMIWVPDWVLQILDTVDHGLPLTNTAALRYLVKEASVCEAHNAGGFERAMWDQHMMVRRGFSQIPVSKWDDTAARAAMCALPRSLDGATKAVGAKAEKDKEGYKLMLKMCRPRALRKKERDALAARLGMTEEEVKSEAKVIMDALKVDPRAPQMLRPDYHLFFSWHENAEDFVRLCDYCIQDVEAEYALAQELPELPKGERKIWELDQTINDRGILCDLESVAHAEAIIETHETDLLEELRDLTGLGSAKAVAAVKGWLADEGCELDTLDKTAVSDALKGDITPAARRVLEIRQSLSKSSTAKLAAFKAYACKDGRLRGTTLYHGAATGRWTGKGPQPHNLPRGDEIISHLQDQAIDLYPLRDPALLSTVLGDPLNVISSCLRGALIAAPGHDLIACDYAAIEGRGLAWLAGEQHVLDAYVEGKDLYKVAASGIYKIPYEQVDGGGKGKQRQVGKVAELACGYQGGWRAMLAFGADRMGMTEEEMKAAVKGWRESRPHTVRFWKGLEEAAFRCVSERVPTKFRAIRFKLHGKYLLMLLPSGRPLWYYAPRIHTMTTPWGEEKRVVTAMTVDGVTKQWKRRPYHGGLWAENCFTADTLVVTARGPVPISKVTAHDRVWDGESWVATDGPKYQGCRRVVKWLGVEVTKNHEITDGKKWMSVGDAEEHFVRSALNWARCSTTSPSFLQALDLIACPCAGVPAVKSSLSKQERFSEKRQGDVLLAERNTQEQKTPRGGGTEKSLETPSCCHCGATGTPGWSPVVTMKTTKPTPITGEEVLEYSSGGWTIGESSIATQRLFSGGINSASTSTESTTTGTTAQATFASLNEKSTQGTSEPIRCCPALGRRCPYPSFTKDSAPDGKASIAFFTTSTGGERQKKLWRDTGAVRAVYDLLNCGDNNRFTVLTEAGPVVVHNCTQAMCRDILALGLIRCEAAGYPPVLHVHDEIVAEVPKGFGSVEEMEQLMSVVPQWAEGMPIRAEGFRGHRYKK